MGGRSAPPVDTAPPRPQPERPEYEDAFGLLRLCLSGQLLALVGVWAALNHRRLGRKYPRSMALLEKVLFTFAPLVAQAHVSMLAVSMLGAEAAPYAVAAACAAHLRLHSTDLVSSPGRRAEGARRAVLDGRSAALIRAFLLAQAPLLHVCAFRHSLRAHPAQHLATVVLLLAVPLALSGPRAARAPAGADGGRRLQGWPLAATLAAIVATAVALEVRIVFTTFAPYLKLAPPMSYLLVTVGTVAGALGASGFVFQEVFEAAGPTLLGAGLSLSACTGAVVLGMPLLLTPAPLVAVGGFVLYAESFSLLEYAVSVAGGVCTAAWFLWEHYWFLDVAVGGMSMRAVCRLALCAGTVSAAIPGIVVHGVHKAANNALLLVQALCVVALEMNLVEADVGDGMPVYAPYLVVVTSIAGVSVVRTLDAAGHVSSEARFVLLPLYLGKLILAIAPTGRHLAATVVLLAALGAPFCVPAGEEGRARPQMSALSGSLLCLFAFSSIIAARFAIFDAIAAVTGYRPYDAFLVGVLLSGMSTSALVVQHRHFRSSVLFARLGAAGLLTGVLMCLMRPPIPAVVAEGFCVSSTTCFRLWDEDPDILMAQSTSAATGPRPQSSSSVWLLVVASLSAASSLFAHTMARKPRHFALISLVLAVTTGTSFGGFVTAGFGWAQKLLVVLATTLVAFVLSALPRVSTAADSAAAVWTTVVPVSLIPLAIFFFISAVLVSIASALRSVDVSAVVGGVLLGSGQPGDDRHEHFRSLCWTYMAYCIVLAFAIKMRLDKLMMTTRSRTQADQQQAIVARLATAGNVVAVLGSLLAYVGSPGSAGDMRICSSGILLLYNVSNDVSVRASHFPQLTSYCPAYISALGFMVASAVAQIVYGPDNIELFDRTWQDDIWVSWNVVVLLMALGSHGLLLAEFFVRARPNVRKETSAMLIALMNIPAFFLTSIWSVRIIAVIGAFCGGLHVVLIRIVKGKASRSI